MRERYADLKPPAGGFAVKGVERPKVKQQWCYECNAVHDWHGPPLVE